MSKKISKKERIKALEYEVLTLRALFEFVYAKSNDRPVAPIQIEPFSEFQKQLRETEAKYSLKAS